MFVNFVSDLLKAAAIDLVFKRPIQIHVARDPSGKLDFRMNVNPSSGGSQQAPVVVMQSPYGYGYPPPYPPAYPQAFAPPAIPASPPPGSGAPSPTPDPRTQQFEINVPEFLRR